MVMKTLFICLESIKNHTGVEFEFSAQINDMFRLDLGAGLGNWLYTEDATGTYRDSDGESSYSYALKDLKVGDMPQANLALGLTASPIEDSKIQLLYRYYALHYSNRVQHRESTLKAILLIEHRAGKRLVTAF